MNKLVRIFQYLFKGIKLAWKEFHFIIPRKLWKSYYKHLKFKLKYGNQQHLFYNPSNNVEYEQWIATKEQFDEQVAVGGKITVIVYSDNNFANQAVIKKSLEEQIYQNFDVVYTNKFEDITTDYVLFVNSEDVLSKYCLNEIVKMTEDVIYFDEDRLENNCRVNPSFKPDFSPDTLLSKNYIGNSFAIKTKLCNLDTINNASLYELVIKASETNLFGHVAKVLVHKNSFNSVANSKEIINNTLKRRNLVADITEINDSLAINYQHNNEKVSILIPTRDGSDILETCLSSIYQKSSYQNFEIIVIDNGSVEEATFQLFNKYKTYDNFSVLRIDKEFNYSLLNNEAARVATGEYILFLNNDTEVITPDWMERMLGYARLEHIGAVGAKLYFPDNTIQHCGVILGLYLVAGHCFWGEARDYIDSNQLTKITSNFSAVTAACMMVKKSKMFEIGGLNEDELKVGSNDVDFCIRLLQKGYYNVVNPDVELYHHESKSRGVDNKTFEKYERCKLEIEYMLNTYSRLIVNDPFYNRNYSLMKSYKLDKYNGAEIRQENIEIFCC